MHSKEPVFNVPGVVLGTIGLLAAIHIGRQYLLSPEDSTQFLLAMAFIPARYFGLSGEIPGGEIAKFTSFVTHQLVHANAVHLVVNSAWLLAFCWVWASVGWPRR